ncbi:MAG: hypothetical protein HY773_02070 [Candidatus Terrybacteria bacterium]|nr:hypothetical protein [Candidatus Terrybacteria bacterium]
MNILKVFGLSAFAFFLAISLTPILTHYLYKYKMWKKKARNEALGGGETPIFHQLHKEKEVGTPRMGGILIWSSALIVVLIFWLIVNFFPSDLTNKLNFLSRGQTWLPLFTLVSASLVGLVDDILQIYGKGKYTAGGLSLFKRILIVIVIGLIGAWWFYYKLGMSTLIVPFVGEINLGIIFIPIFILTMLLMFSGGVIDGLDGLSGGIFAIIFSAYSGIAFFQNQIDLAAFCSVLVGGILAFLWFNIPPARFYMGETGILGLTTALTVVAFLTKSTLALLIISFPLIATSASVVIQLISKKFFHRKVFLVAPMHHHFEALGWPAYKVTMRYWVISIILAVIGLVIALVGK